MIIWINGAFGSGKTTTSYELERRIPNSFVYDPENIGFFIRKNVPKPMWKDDFQDHSLWREFNHSMLRTIESEYSGIIIVPMTIVNRQYFDEIITKLKADGVVIHHFTLMATQETLLKRLKSRGDHKNSWPAKQIDRCITALSEDIFAKHIHTDNLTPDEILDHIARDCGIELQPDHRGMFKKKADRIITKIKHIRF